MYTNAAMSRRDTPSAPACADGAALPAAELIERRHELCRAKYIEMANCVDSSMNATGQTVLNENHFIRLLQSLRVRRVAVAYSNKEKEKQDSVGQKDRLSVHTKKHGGDRLGVEFLWFCRSRDEGERRDERGEDDGAGGEARGAGGDGGLRGGDGGGVFGRHGFGLGGASGFGEVGDVVGD